MQGVVWVVSTSVALPVFKTQTEISCKKKNKLMMKQIILPFSTLLPVVLLLTFALQITATQVNESALLWQGRLSQMYLFCFVLIWETDTQTERLSSWWLIPKISTMARARFCWTQEPGTQSRSPLWWQQPSYSSYYCSLPGSALQEIELIGSNTACRHPNQCLNH